MKKMLLSLCLIPSMVLSQTSLKVVAVPNAQVCPGDSLTVYYKFTPSTESTWRGMQIHLIGPNWNQVWAGDSTYFASQPFDSTLGVGLYHIKLWVTPNMAQGWGLLYVLYYPDIHFIIALKCNVTVGIIEYEYAEKAIYYDLIGNKITKRYNELIIQEIQGIRKKVIMQ